MSVTEETSLKTQQAALPYTPSAILNIFNNALNHSSSKIVMQAKGVYIPRKGMNYGGYYYDQLKDEASDSCMTLVTSAVIRAMLIAEQVIECFAFLTKKVETNGAGLFCN